MRLNCFEKGKCLRNHELSLIFIIRPFTFFLSILYSVKHSRFLLKDIGDTSLVLIRAVALPSTRVEGG